MGMVERMVQPGVLVTLHANQPGSPGSALVRSETIPRGLFVEGDDYVVNRGRIDLDVLQVGTIRYAAAWIEGQLEGVARLEAPEEVGESSVVYFPRGDLRLQRQRQERG